MMLDVRQQILKWNYNDNIFTGKVFVDVRQQILKWNYNTVMVAIAVMLMLDNRF